jgi:ABC-type multidrug transport system ATPase subunit
VPAVERIEVRRVTRLFGAVAALRGVCATFRPATSTFITGPNGAGKSTLLSVVGTMLAPNSGSVEYVPLGVDRDRARGRIGYVAHESHCYPELSARQNVELAARLYGADPRKAWSRVAERVGAGHFAERPVGTLSRGQRQRVALARALTHSPDVLLLDEPWTGLDQTSSELFFRVLEEEVSRGCIVVVVSHALEWASRLGSLELKLSAGRVVG